MRQPAFELSDVSLSAANHSELRHVSLCFYPGEVHFLAAEHSDALDSLFALVQGNVLPTSGTASLGEGLGPTDIFYVSNQAPTHLFPEFTLAENIFFHILPQCCKGRLQQIDRDLLRHRCLQLLEPFCLNWDPNEKVAHMGLAQKQLVALLRALVTPCPIVLLHEPAALFTDVEQEIAYRIIKQIRSANRCVVISATKLQEIHRYGDVLTIIQNGSIRHTLPIDSTVTENHLLALLVGTCCVNRYPHNKSAPGKPIFCVRGLSAYDVLDDISFLIREGEILGITGLAGSGRSMLCRSLFGLEDCIIEDLSIYGKSVEISDSASAIAQGMAYLPEERLESSILPNMNIGHNLSLASLHRFLKKKLVLDTVYETYLVDIYLKKMYFSAAVSCNDPMRRLSDGEQQKLMLGKWMMSGARIYILDEPTNKLDIASKVDLYNMIVNLKNKGCGILLVSSDIEELLGMADQILVISQGRITLKASARHTSKEQLLQAASH